MQVPIGNAASFRLPAPLPGPLPAPLQASVASAACALLPFVPTYAVALPGCAVLLAQGRLLAAVLFFALHFMGYYIGDTVILEVRAGRGGYGALWRGACPGRSRCGGGAGVLLVCGGEPRWAMAVAVGCRLG